MELVCPETASFEIITADTRFVVNPAPTFSGESKLSIFTHPPLGADSAAEWEYSIYELGEFELYSTFIINTPVASTGEDGSRSDIELIYTIATNLTNMTLVAHLSQPPSRKVIDALMQTQNASIMAIDLEYVAIETAALADFIRKMETKRLVLRTPSDPAKLEKLLKELDIAEPSRYNKTNLQTGAPKDTLTAIVLNQT